MPKPLSFFTLNCFLLGGGEVSLLLMQKRHFDRGSNPLLNETHQFILFTRSSQASSDIWKIMPNSLFQCGRFPFTKRFRKFRLGCKWSSHDFSVCSTGKFSEKMELLKRYSRFAAGNFPMENLRSIYRILVFIVVITRSRPFAVF